MFIRMAFRTSAAVPGFPPKPALQPRVLCSKLQCLYQFWSEYSAPECVQTFWNTHSDVSRSEERQPSMKHFCATRGPRGTLREYRPDSITEAFGHDMARISRIDQAQR